MEQQLLLFLEGLAGALQSRLAALQLLDYLMLLAGLLGLAALLMFLRSDRTARYQRDREAQLRAAERELQLRKEVYLPAAEAIGRAQDFLGKSPLLDLTQEQALAVVNHVLGALGKAQLVASQASLEPLMAVAAEFTASYAALQARRQPLLRLKAEIAELSSAIEHLAVERDYLLSRLTRLAAERGSEQAELWRQLSRRFDKLHQEIGSMLGKRKDRTVELAQLEHEFAVEAQQRALRLAKLGVPAYLALREELQLEIDATRFQALARRSIGEIERSIRSLTEAKRARPGLRRVDGRQSERREPIITPLEPAAGEPLKAAMERGV